jgi:hypothetical protein
MENIRSASICQRLRRDLRALAGLLFGYTAVAYFLMPVWWRYHSPSLALERTPRVTRTANGIPGDLVNVALSGTEEEVVEAFLAAGWYPADPTTWRTSLRIAATVVTRRSYPQAPVSDLYLFGRRQDLAFQLSVGKSPKQRHHVRFWRALDLEGQERPLWVGAATFDASVGLGTRTGQITHHVAAEVDAERDKILDDLQEAGHLRQRMNLGGTGASRRGRNGGGDLYFTDGRVAYGELAASP